MPPCRCTAAPPLAIAYSDTTQDRFLASRSHLLTHERVLETLMEQIPNAIAVPLPLQFGLVVTSWEQVHQDLIGPQQSQLQTLLHKLIGKREVGIKLFWDQTAELNRLLDRNPDLQQRRDALKGRPLTMDEAIGLGQELEALLTGHQRFISQSFLDTLTPLSHEQAPGELLTENMILNAAFLIDNSREPEFAETVERLDEQFEHRIRIRYNNFTAPYNFVALD
ncbi:MAG: GvpL/GvpF family gas vesicle protein [Oscillatoriales cyanobacterium SM2_2_1]|nr:GvpL/GvpF family gas vesicle protein [Oscillatoriales cyanobacterium SM2_2_1]